jgi:hypothetical protein
MRWKGFYVGRAQRIAALLLLVLFGECCWTIAHSSLTATDYRYARCGREMWEHPEAIQGYFTTCGNLNGDGTLAYRVAALPLSLERGVLLAADHFRKPADRHYTDGSLNGTLWEARSELNLGPWLLRLPFVFFAIWLGGGLWWVSKRLFGPEGGALALALYVFCPDVIRYAVHPNNEVLAMWGLYGLVYTSMGVAHALQGPRRKWKFRIALLTVALGLTATAHLLAAAVGLIAGTAFCLYLAERNRRYVMQIVLLSVAGAVFVLLAAFSFRLSAFQYVLSGGSARFWFTTGAVRLFASSPANLPIVVATVLALLLYVITRRSRYFGNTAPLLMTAALAFLYTTQVTTAPWFWALPFLFTFLGGVFADVLESRSRRMYLAVTGAIVVAQAGFCWASMVGRL